MCYPLKFHNKQCFPLLLALHTLVTLFSFQGAVLISVEIRFKHLVSKCLNPTSTPFTIYDPVGPYYRQLKFSLPTFFFKRKLVGPSGLEPPTSRLSVVRSSQLSYGPVPSSLDCLSSDLRPYDTIGCQLKFSLLPFFFKRKEVVEISGIEPLTPCLQSRCSPS